MRWLPPPPSPVRPDLGGREVSTAATTLPSPRRGQIWEREGRGAASAPPPSLPLLRPDLGAGGREGELPSPLLRRGHLVRAATVAPHPPARARSGGREGEPPPPSPLLRRRRCSLFSSQI
ncbi:hypothetical protein [Oryza sativa Japonica Group]|uniref:Uncharacterized protein n=1 Tax=Oryza sativa subsp. japonica TaxID=39947 RepID=Q5ZEE2_ORYSJ|nr:hypothetical protein [Oryza sativa Japonica Group]